jgi:hypothetical protein
MELRYEQVPSTWNPAMKLGSATRIRVTPSGI